MDACWSQNDKIISNFYWQHIFPYQFDKGIAKKMKNEKEGEEWFVVKPIKFAKNVCLKTEAETDF